ncbi:MAG: hypothetical protein M3R13_09255 [Armatimonadota bacterium]|nr:hypothetical protein [Armatimonadota bacterium]
MAGLISGLGAAAIVFVVIYTTTAVGLFDASGLQQSANDPLENAMSAALLLGCYGLVLGPLLIWTRGFWTGSLLMLLPFAMPMLLALLAGNFSTVVTEVILAITIGIVARLAADFATRGRS